MGILSDDTAQLIAAQDLAEYLSMATEDTMMGFSLDEFVPCLIDLLQVEHNPDIMLLACRCFANLVEAMPHSAQAIAAAGAIDVLVGKLLNIEYIDLAEQALITLEKLSSDIGTTILRAGGTIRNVKARQSLKLFVGLNAVLCYLDFFPIGVQRSALNTAANICKRVPRDAIGLVQDSIPTLSNLLRHSDTKIIERACLCFARYALVIGLAFTYKVLLQTAGQLPGQP